MESGVVLNRLIITPICYHNHHTHQARAAKFISPWVRRGDADSDVDASPDAHDPLRSGETTVCVGSLAREPEAEPAAHSAFGLSRLVDDGRRKKLVIFVSTLAVCSQRCCVFCCAITVVIKVTTRLGSSYKLFFFRCKPRNGL